MDKYWLNQLDHVQYLRKEKKRCPSTEKYLKLGTSKFQGIS